VKVDELSMQPDRGTRVAKIRWHRGASEGKRQIRPSRIAHLRKKSSGERGERLHSLAKEERHVTGMREKVIGGNEFQCAHCHWQSSWTLPGPEKRETTGRLVKADYEVS